MAAMDDEPPKKKAKSVDVDDLPVDSTSAPPVCPYGTRCYRKNPKHFKEYSHPPKDATSTTTPTTHTIPIDTSKLPPCEFGAKCYRKNLLHFAEFSHPFKTSGEDEDWDGTSVVPEDDSGSDTDVYDLDDDEEETDKKAPAALTKSYSQMSESERRELIQRAADTKQQLEQQLADTKRQVEQMHDQVSEGLLLLDGEKEALAGSEVQFFDLIPERAYKEGSAAQAHFRLAESQFYRLLSGGATSNHKVTKVQYIVNPQQHAAFKKAQEMLKVNRGESCSYPVLAFHGTKAKNITSIIHGGFKVPGDSAFTHRTDRGYYGAGVYFSEYPNYSMGYIQGCNKILLCQVLLGKVYQCPALILGKPLMEGYDSHVSPNKKELIIFNSDHILPCYLVQYVTQVEFTYQVGEKKKTGDALMKLYWKAAKAKSSTIFAGNIFGFSGRLCNTHQILKQLVKKHGASEYSKPKYPMYGAHGYYYNVLICTEECMTTTKSKYKAANMMGLPIVSEQYVYDSILAGECQFLYNYSIE